ncbi:hypothetical protein Ga0100231_001910 [Opitutaceae bacterium TAV4]|uniref:hypothetical protein n=1 Tax=Geminisphaera colitermitum TaxID=1148786 RepID=UPI000158CF71|nr:hypothetical protein [Geminisphaera colitermitum]RRJ97335.1 hypothetical protein Ga0100231_001910 [Opitutaceae bacterium TAV4]RRK01728.1 hypothetical protein Ga0100230_000100 [Opitutaceae bacterium TAV3]
MKKQLHCMLSLPALLIGLAAAQLQAAVSITPALLPDLNSFTAGSITLRQDIAERTVGIRYQSAGNIRSDVQSFKWNTEQALAGIAIKLASDASLSESQNFELRIFEIAAVTNGSAVNSKLETYQFSLSPASIVGGNYLYLSIPNGLTLIKDRAYQFQLAATSMVASNSLSFVATNSGNDPFPNGSGSQASYNTDPTTVVSAGWDFTFALVAVPAVPEPATAGLTLAGGILTFVALLRWHRSNTRTRDQS